MRPRASPPMPQFPAPAIAATTSNPCGRPSSRARPTTAVVVTVPLPWPGCMFHSLSREGYRWKRDRPGCPLIAVPVPPSPRGCRTDAERCRPCRDARGRVRRGAALLPAELDTRGALTRLWDHLKKGQKQRLYGWFQQWADIEAQATVLRWYEPLVVPGLLQTEEYARAILSARPDGNLDDLDEQVAARLARQAILDRTGAPQLWCILDEGVLHRAIGGSKVMRSQLYRRPDVAVRSALTRPTGRAGNVPATGHAR